MDRSRTPTQVSVSSSRLGMCSWCSPKVFGSSFKVTICCSSSTMEPKVGEMGNRKGRNKALERTLSTGTGYVQPKSRNSAYRLQSMTRAAAILGEWIFLLHGHFQTVYAYSANGTVQHGDISLKCVSTGYGYVPSSRGVLSNNRDLGCTSRT